MNHPEQCREVGKAARLLRHALHRADAFMCCENNPDYATDEANEMLQDISAAFDCVRLVLGVTQSALVVSELEHLGEQAARKTRLVRDDAGGRSRMMVDIEDLQSLIGAKLAKRRDSGGLR